VHGHDPVYLLSGLRPRGPLVETEARLFEHGLDLRPRGDRLFGLTPIHQPGLRDAVAALEAEGDFAAELVAAPEPPHLPALFAARPPDDEPEWLWARFASAHAAAACAATLSGAVAAGEYLLLAARRVGPRAGWLAQRAGGVAEVLPGPTLCLRVLFWRPGAALAVATMATELRARLPGDRLDVGEEHGAPSAAIVTGAPERALVEAVALAASHEARAWIQIGPADPVAAALARVDRDLPR
jgi:hypothetical protein